MKRHLWRCEKSPQILSTKAISCRKTPKWAQRDLQTKLHFSWKAGSTNFNWRQGFLNLGINKNHKECASKSAKKKRLPDRCPIFCIFWVFCTAQWCKSYPFNGKACILLYVSSCTNSISLYLSSKSILNLSFFIWSRIRSCKWLLFYWACAVRSAKQCDLRYKMLQEVGHSFRRQIFAVCKIFYSKKNSA